MKVESNIGGLLGKSSRLLANRFNSDLVTLGFTVEQWSYWLCCGMKTIKHKKHCKWHC